MMKLEFLCKNSLVWIWFVIILFALTAPFLASSLPNIVILDKSVEFPSFYEFAARFKVVTYPVEKRNPEYWLEQDVKFIIWPPIPYSPHQVNLDEAMQAPTFWRSHSKTGNFHILGTDLLGRDVLSYLLHGTTTALLLSFLSVVLGFVLGTLLGVTAGYFGNDKITIKRGSLVTLPIWFAMAWFYGFQVQWSDLLQPLYVCGLNIWNNLVINNFIFCFVFFSGLFLSEVIFRRILYFKHQVRLPIDFLVMRLIEIFSSIPKILLILALSVVLLPSIMNLVVIFVIISWPSIARLWRTGVIHAKGTNYVQAGEALGISQTRILFRHILPNTIQPILISLSFATAGVILAESSLAFLGLGMPSEIVSWGRLLNQARQMPEAWWLVLFPGICITGLIGLAYQTGRMVKKYF